MTDVIGRQEYKKAMDELYRHFTGEIQNLRHRIAALEADKEKRDNDLKDFDERLRYVRQKVFGNSMDE